MWIERCSTLEKREILGGKKTWQGKGHSSLRQQLQNNTQTQEEAKLHASTLERKRETWFRLWHSCTRLWAEHEGPISLHHITVCKRFIHNTCFIQTSWNTAHPFDQIAFRDEAKGLSCKMNAILECINMTCWRGESADDTLTLLGTPAQPEGLCWVWRLVRVLCQCRQMTSEGCSCT